MDSNTRKALQTLQGLRDEGFVDEAEYSARRKKIIDAATQVPNATAKSSVFARLGEQSSFTGQTGDTWAHDGYESLYGTGSKTTKTKLAGISKAKQKTSQKTDLRSRLANNKGRTANSHGSGQKPRGPARCPW